MEAFVNIKRLEIQSLINTKIWFAVRRKFHQIQVGLVNIVPAIMIDRIRLIRLKTYGKTVFVLYLSSSMLVTGINTIKIQ